MGPAPTGLNGSLARRSASADLTPSASLLVDAGGRRLQGELRRLRGIAPRYALLISNETPLYLLVSFRVRRGGADRPIPPGDVWIDPQSTADFAFGISPALALRGGWLVVRLVNSHVRRELIAPLPGASAFAGAAAGALAAGLIAMGLAFAQPRIDEFAVPPVGVADASLRVAYRTSGVGHPTYALEDDRGATIASGALRAASGTLALPLPRSSRARTYVVRLRQSGAFGSAERAAPLTALPSATAAPRALIEALSVDRAQAAPGDTIVAHYRTAADRGRIVLRDDANTVWAQAPLTRDGTARLLVPAFSGDRDLRVTLEAARGSERSSSTVGVAVVVPPPPPTAAPAAGAADIVRVRADGDRVRAGGVVRVAIASGTTGVHLALERPDGTPVASADVPRGALEGSVGVPRDVRGDVMFVATYDAGNGQVSIVRHLAVAPP